MVSIAGGVFSAALGVEFDKQLLYLLYSSRLA